MKVLSAYLTFNGNCLEAMKFYNESLGGELNFMTFDGAPMEVPEDFKQKILHSTLAIGDYKIMASDSMLGQNVVNGSSISLSVECDNLEELERFFKNMSVGATITMPLEDTFWNARFGMLIDKFGIPWMFNYEKEQN